MNSRTCLILGGIIFTTVLTLTGCDSKPKLSAKTAQALYEIAKANQPDQTKDEEFAALDWSLGTVPKGGTRLPLTSPDGKWMAIEDGPSISGPTLLALPDAPIPNANGVVIWEVDARASKLNQTHRLPGPLLLGNSSDSEGFLVESPRLNGSRWIGKVAWDTGRIQWLVQDENVNAFGSIGPRGELAWSTRTITGSQFSLAIRMPDGDEIGIAANGGEWLMPEWSTRSSRLSVLFLADDGLLAMVSMDARTPELLQSTPRQYTLMADARRYDALVTRSTHPVIQNGTQPSFEEVIFFHPKVRSMFVWLPTNIQKDPPVGLSPDSVAAANDPNSDGYLVSTASDLRWQDPNYQSFVRVRYGAAIPRATTSNVAPFLLFVPSPNGFEVRALIPNSINANTDAAS
ncbi:MAG: hypothetical protein MK089_08870 [Phycisphaerales bacterium]|nr:hypothetical protein [Phycisphaerales bacterium]